MPVNLTFFRVTELTQLPEWLIQSREESEIPETWRWLRTRARRKSFQRNGPPLHTEARPHARPSSRSRCGAGPLPPPFGGDQLNGEGGHWGWFAPAQAVHHHQVGWSEIEGRWGKKTGRPWMNISCCAITRFKLNGAELERDRHLWKLAARRAPSYLLLQCSNTAPATVINHNTTTTTITTSFKTANDHFDEISTADGVRSYLSWARRPGF